MLEPRVMRIPDHVRYIIIQVCIYRLLYEEDSSVREVETSDIEGRSVSLELYTPNPDDIAARYTTRDFMAYYRTV